MRRYSLVDIAPTIASLLHIDLPPCDGKPIPSLLNYAAGCERTVLIVVDSLGLDLFYRLRPCLPTLNQIEDKGFFTPCESVVDKTTPALTSILSGRRPENHGVFEMDNEGPDVPCILELHDNSAVVLEDSGARTFEGRVGIILGIVERENIYEFDEDTRVAVLKAIEMDAGLVFAHFRGIDRDSHCGRGLKGVKKSAMLIDSHINAICERLPDDMVLIVCGDHTPHSTDPDLLEAGGMVPLFAWRRI